MSNIIKTIFNIKKTASHFPLCKSTESRLISTAMEIINDKNTTEEDHLNIQYEKKNTRYSKRNRKREWDDTPRDNGEKRPCPEEVRVKRKNMAMLLGYCGAGYYGMQRNPGVPTIEEEICKVLLETKYINQESFEMMQKAKFQRAARTDKGVSAARQVVSVKLPLEAKPEDLNKLLPETIKVFGIKRVTKGFNSKSACDARTYAYILPTYVFDTSVETEEDRRKYRIPQDKIDLVNKVLEEYRGTKSYHNFTEKKSYTDPSCRRYMTSFKVEEVFVDRDLEFAVLRVKGQSFMLHQIRKMVGLALAIIRGTTDESIMQRAFGEQKTILSTAPGLNLMLEYVHYDRYNKKFQLDGLHSSLDFEDISEEVEKFKKEHIYPTITQPEAELFVFADFLAKLSKHSYDPSDETESERKEDDEKEESDSENDKDTKS